MGRVLVTLTEGIESPTEATLAMLVAEAAIAEGYDVSVFFAADVGGLPFTLTSPAELVKLSVAADPTLSY